MTQLEKRTFGITRQKAVRLGINYFLIHIALYGMYVLNGWFKLVMIPGLIVGLCELWFLFNDQGETK